MLSVARLPVIINQEPIRVLNVISSLVSDTTTGFFMFVWLCFAHGFADSRTETKQAVVTWLPKIVQDCVVRHHLKMHVFYAPKCMVLLSIIGAATVFALNGAAFLNFTHTTSYWGLYATSGMPVRP